MTIDPESVLEKTDLVTWPNPSKDDFTLILRSPNTVDNIDIQVYDLNGRLVYSKKGNANQEYRLGTSLKGGLYFVNVSQGNNAHQLKLIKY